MKIAELGKFWFDDSVSPEEMGAIKPYIEKWQLLVPAWCESVHVMCAVNNPEETSGCTAQIKTEQEYRRAHLTIFALWLNEPPDFREQAIIHELIHLYTETHRQFSGDLITMFATKYPLRKYLQEQLRKVNEATTEDLMLMVHRIQGKV